MEISGNFNQPEFLSKPNKKQKLNRRSRYSFAEPPKETVEDKSSSPLLTKIQLISKEYISAILASNNINEINIYNYELRYFLEQDQDFINEISKDEELVENFINAFGLVDTADGLEAYCKMIYPFFKRNTVAFIDNGLLFNLRDKIDVFPDQVLDFYETIPLLSGYARDAMISLGIIDDVIDYFNNAKTTKERVAAATVLQSQFIIPHPFQVDDIRGLIPKLVPMLKCGDNEAVALIIRTLSEINGREQVFTEDFLENNVHLFLVESIKVPELTSASLTLAGNMSICEPDGVVKMIDCGLISEILKLSTDHPLDVFWCLANCFESSPKSMFKIIKDLIPRSHEDDSPESACFIATVLLFGQSEDVLEIIDDEMLKKVINAVNNKDVDISARCLDSISRLLILTHTRKEIKSKASSLFAPETKEKIELASKSEIKLVSGLATRILKVMAKC
jgi:hypothetical protein